MRSKSSRAGRTDTDLAGRPCASRPNREAGPVVAGMAPAEQRQHVLCAVSRPERKLSMLVQIE
jgi:hypothetical protein